MKKLIISFVVFFLLLSNVVADVTIDSKNHVQNMVKGHGGLCSWAALETLGKTHGWKQLETLMDEHDRSAVHDVLFKTIKNKKVAARSYQATEQEWWYLLWYQPKGGSQQLLTMNRNKKISETKLAEKKDPGAYWIEQKAYLKVQFVKDAIDEGLGAAVTIIEPDPGKPIVSHMLVITHMDDKEVWFCDSNYKPGNIRKNKLNDFLSWWSGYALVIEKNK